MEKVTLFLMNQKGLFALKTIIEYGYYDMIDKVVIAHDKNVVNDYYDDLLQYAKSVNMIVSDKSEDVKIQSKYCIAIGWRWIINVPNFSHLIVMHDSLLPKYRGFAPLVNMLLNHEPEIGVTAIFARDDYDQGPIIAQRSSKVSYPIRIAKAIDLVSQLYGNLLLEILSQIGTNGIVEGVPQDDENASFSLWRDEEDYHIDWSQSSLDIQQFVFSVGYPFKGAYSMCDNIKIRIIDCEVLNDVQIENRTPGKLIFKKSGYPVIVCGKGLLKLTKVTDEKGNDIINNLKFRIRLK